MKQLRPYQLDAVNECWEALKKNDEPVLLMASVGAGKSLMLSDILLTMQKKNKLSLCLVNNAELVRNNCQTFIEYGGLASIYCAALGFKDTSNTVIFGTPQSIINGINKNEQIGKIKFNLIVVDEAHAINFNDNRCCFMRILRHYKQEYGAMRLLGATGTNFRFKGTAITGQDCLFKSQIGNITTEKLITQGYLVKPIFEVDESLVIDFSKVKIRNNGRFCQKQLSEVVDNNVRLTQTICEQLIHIMESQHRFGVFIFATTKKHAYEILSHLPRDTSAIILGDTPQDERTRLLEMARQGSIRYLVNIAIISVGVDVPAYDTIAYLRPTESLVLLVQTMGRALRLSPSTNKQTALCLDFAGNIARHRDWDNPVLLDALKQTIDKDKPLVIICPVCQTLNTEHARRCVGLINDKRCDYFFEFKECPNPECGVKNDVSVRHCRLCEAEIIDPNSKLSLSITKKPEISVHVLEAKYSLSGQQSSFKIECAYTCQDNEGKIGVVRESYFNGNEKSRNIFYGNFVRKHCDKASSWYMHLNNRFKMLQMLKEANSPISLVVSLDGGKNKIKRKIFE
jgi:DNA repair protein RadD